MISFILTLAFCDVLESQRRRHCPEQFVGGKVSLHKFVDRQISLSLCLWSLAKDAEVGNLCQFVVQDFHQLKDVADPVKYPSAFVSGLWLRTRRLGISASLLFRI